MQLHVIVVSTRPQRVGPTVAIWFMSMARGHGAFDVRLVDLAVVNLPFLDEPEHPSRHLYSQQHTREWSATVAAADAFVFVMPEYNFGFTAPLKNAIDFLCDEWAYKPVGFVGYGIRSMGLRAVQMLKPVLTTLKMMPVTETVAIPLRRQLDDRGVLHADDVMEAAATAMLAELERVASALAPLRRGCLPASV